MQFSAILTAVLATAAAAAPNDLKTRAVNNQAEAIAFAAEAADCSLIKCASVVANAVCIVAAIRGGAKGALVGCVKDGIDAICPCVSCVPGLGDFVNDQNIC